MRETKYTEEEINWAIDKLNKKHPEKATKEQAIKLLNTMRGFTDIVVDKIEEDKKYGKLKSELSN